MPTTRRCAAPSSTRGAQPARSPGRSASTTSLPLDALDRLLARLVDLGDADGVGGRERGAELARQVSRPRVEVRLEEHEHAAVRPLARRRDRRGDLARVVRVVVDDRDAAALADELETATGAAEAREHGLGVGARDAGELERRQRRRRVPPVVRARHE